MTKAKTLGDELREWKDKYFELKESLEANQKDEDAFRSVLQRMLLRLCLSAEGQSSDFDKQLTKVRSDVRRNDITVDQLADRLNALDEALSKIDRVKSANGKRYADLIREMSEQLEAFKPPSAEKKDLKKLIKHVRSTTLTLEHFLPALNDYAKVQKSTLQWLSENTPDQPGLMKRIFGSKGQTDEDPVEAVKSSEDAQDARFEIQAQLDSDEQSEPPSEATIISTQVRTALNSLLDQLTFPESAQRALDSLRARISGPLNWTELGITLDDLSSIIISSVGRGQRDFGSFLSDIEERLELIQSVVMDTLQADQKLRAEEQTLDKNVRHQINSMQDSLEKETQLEGLKKSIKLQVDSIFAALDQFSEASDAIHSSKEQDYETLKARFDALEKESRQFREQIKAERSKALTDSLTQIPNREAYDERFMLEYERFKRYKKPITLVVADVDHFKSVNDEYGHLSGDKVLQILAKEFSNRIRSTDFVARLGGEEFVFLLPETDITSAKNVVEQTREMISRLPFHFRDQNVRITASFGMIEFQDDLSPTELFDRADQAMYKAKQNGRNRIETATR